MEKLFTYLDIKLLTNGSIGKTTNLLILNNPDGSPRWICNANSKKPYFLKFYATDTLKYKLLTLGLRIIFALKIQKIIFETKKICYTKSNGQKDVEIDLSKSNWAIFSGTTGPNNKLVIFEKNDTGNKFYKIAPSKKALNLLDNEEEVLRRLKLLSPRSFIFPQSERPSRRMLELDDISHKGKRTNLFTNIHQQVLSELYKKTVKEMKIAELPIFKECNQKLEQIKNCKDARIPKGMVKKLGKMLINIENDTIEVALGHGDFTPWNMYLINDKLAIYDWELSRPLMPLGFDAFHYIIQCGILVDKKNWNEIKDEIYRNMTPLQFEEWSLSGDVAIEDYLSYYLIFNAILGLAIYANQQEWHVQVYWLLNTWNESLSDMVRKSYSNRGLMILDLFDFLNHKKYAAVKFPDYAPERLGELSDVDLCIEKNDLSKIINYLKHHSLTFKVHAISKTFMSTIQIFLKDGSFLSIDLIWKLKRKWLVMMKTDKVIQNSKLNIYNIKQMDLEDQIRYIGLFYALNNSKIPDKYIGYHPLLSNAKSKLDQILHANYLHGLTHKRELITCLKNEKVNKHLKGLKNLLDYYYDCFVQLFSSKGMIITFSGVDGAGKSTVIENIKLKLEKKTRKKVVVLRHRPSLLPILSVWVKGKRKAENDVLNSLPRKGGNNNYLTSLLRFIYYYTDYLFGQFYIYFKYVKKGYVVLYDRYYFDFINDSKRSNIRLPKSLIKKGYKLLIKPNLNFFLYADPEVILERKQELNSTEIELLTNDYKNLFNELNEKDHGQYLSIENNVLSDTIDSIMSKTTQRLSHL